MKNDNLEPLMTEQEVCDFLKVNPHTLRHWRRTGKIRFVKIERHIRFYQSDIISLLKDNTRAVG